MLLNRHCECNFPGEGQTRVREESELLVEVMRANAPNFKSLVIFL